LWEWDGVVSLTGPRLSKAIFSVTGGRRSSSTADALVPVDRMQLAPGTARHHYQAVSGLAPQNIEPTPLRRKRKRSRALRDVVVGMRGVNTERRAASSRLFNKNIRDGRLTTKILDTDFTPRGNRNR